MEVAYPSPPQELPSIGTRSNTLCWFSALAWICTRDLDLTLKLHTDLNNAQTSYAEAGRLFHKAIDQRHPSANREFLMPIKEAEEELLDGLMNSAIDAECLGQTGERRPVPRLWWLDRITKNEMPHDSLLVLSDTGDEPEIFLRVAFSTKQVLARWPTELAWLKLLLTKRWEADQLVYWVEHGSLAGFARARGRVGGRLGLTPDDVLSDIRRKLAKGLVHALQREKRTGLIIERNAAWTPIPPEFWKGHGLLDEPHAAFDVESILRAWPTIPPRLFRQFDSQKAFIEHVMRHLLCTKKNAESLMEICQIAKGKPGPRPEIKPRE